MPTFILIWSFIFYSVFASIHNHGNIRTIQTTAKGENPAFHLHTEPVLLWEFKADSTWQLLAQLEDVIQPFCNCSESCALPLRLSMQVKWRRCRKSLANTQQCEIEWCWMFPRSLNQACSFPGLVSVLLCRDFSRCQSGHICLFPGTEIRTDEWQGATTHSDFILLGLRQYGSVIKWYCITQCAYHCITQVLQNDCTVCCC